MSRVSNPRARLFGKEEDRKKEIFFMFFFFSLVVFLPIMNQFYFLGFIPIARVLKFDNHSFSLVIVI